MRRPSYEVISGTTLMEPDEPPGVPEWVVTYGDMMSLLLTFFIMLVSMSEVVANAKYRAVLQSMTERFGYTTTTKAPPGDSYPLNSLIERLDTLGAFTEERRAPGGIRINAPEGTELRVFRGREGMAITVGGPMLFEEGTAEISSEAATIIAGIAKLIVGKPNKIEVRGHTSTDPLPPDCEFPDKTALSYERARMVLESLEQAGIAHRRLRAAAAADTQPLSGDAEESDRVEIFVLDAFTEEFIGRGDVVN